MNEVKDEDDYQAIRKAIDALNQGTMRLAELMMDSAVSTRPEGQDHGRGRHGRRPGRAASRWRKQNLNKAVSHVLSRSDLSSFSDTRYRGKM